MKKDQVEQIITYLDQAMPLKERTAFETQLQNDETLAKEVTFQRNLHGFLDRYDPEMEDKLSALGDEFIVGQKHAFAPRILSISILLLLVLLVYFLFFYKKNATSNLKNDLPKIEIPQEKTPNSTIEEIPQEIKIPPKETIKIPSKKQKITPKPPINQPIAALNKTDFEPNPSLESVIQENYRGDDAKIITTINIPKPDAIFKYESTIPLLVDGFSSNTDFDYRLTIYSNRPYDIENDYRLLDTPLKSIQKNEQNHFRFNAQIPLKRGLYYLVIRKDGTRDIVYISRFTVK